MEREQPSRVAAVILAAGESRRYGTPKQLAELEGRTLLEHVLQLAVEAGLRPVVAVVPVWLSRPAAYNDPEALRWVRNPHPERGMSHSLRLGFAALPPEVEAALILLGDQPQVPVRHLQAVVAARGERPLIATSVDGTLTPPVLVERSHFGIVDEPGGDVGLREVLNAHPEWVVAVEPLQPIPDVDTPDDLARLAGGEPCPGCGLRLPGDPDGPRHEYIGASSACWALYTEVAARLAGYGLPGRHVVDAYAAQHPGVDGRRQRQSVAVHLIGLCHRYEHGLDDAEVTRVAQQILRTPRDWPWLTPPASYAATIADLASARDRSGLATASDRYARAVWDAWVAQHQTVRRWAAEALGRQG